jgi:membrane-associated phospholipid phosphatase
MGEWLHSLVAPGTEFLVWLQSFVGTWLEALFRFFTILGNEEFYLFLLPVVYWCLSRRVGIGLGYLSMLSVWLNSVVKHIFDVPRPSDPRLRVRWPETSPSFPSGHSQSAATNWGYLALQLRRWVWTVVAILLIVFISLSRMVLGVHFPQDLLGGWTIGLIVLFLYAWAEPRVSSWLGRQQVGLQATLAVAFPLILMILHPADTHGLYPAEGAVTPASALVGLGWGVIMERAWVRFDVGGPWHQRLLRLALGLVIVVVFYAGPKLLLPAEMPYAAEVAVRFARYVLLGVVIAFGCPWLFVKLGLAPREVQPAGTHRVVTSSL